MTTMETKGAYLDWPEVVKLLKRRYPDLEILSAAQAEEAVMMSLTNPYDARNAMDRQMMCGVIEDALAVGRRTAVVALWKCRGGMEVWTDAPALAGV